ncbi:MAG: hypothetical protein JOY51_04510 [Nevskia sp.]|nr:hypothetical protein [Nevskia sp.]
MSPHRKPAARRIPAPYPYAIRPRHAGQPRRPRHRGKAPILGVRAAHAVLLCLILIMVLSLGHVVAAAVSSFKLFPLVQPR